MINVVAAEKKLNELKEEEEIVDWTSKVGSDYKTVFYISGNGEVTKYTEEEMHEFLKDQFVDWGNDKKHWK